MLSDLSTGTGENFSDIKGVKLSSDESYLYLTDISKDSLFKVDVLTGNRTVLSGPDLGVGPVMDSPQDIGFGATSSKVLIIDSTNRALFEVDTSTGARRIISR